MTPEPFNWNTFWLAIVGAIAAWNSYQSSRRDKAINQTQKVADDTQKAVAVVGAKVEQVVVKVEEVHKLTNGNMGAALQTNLTSAKALVAVENTTENKALAALAQAKVDDHQRANAEINAAKP